MPKRKHKIKALFSKQANNSRAVQDGMRNFMLLSPTIGLLRKGLYHNTETTQDETYISMKTVEIKSNDEDAP